MKASDIAARESGRVVALLTEEDQEWVAAHRMALVDDAYQSGRRHGRLTDLGLWVVGLGLLLGGVAWGGLAHFDSEQAESHSRRKADLETCSENLEEAQAEGARIRDRCLERVVCGCEGAQ